MGGLHLSLPAGIKGTAQARALGQALRRLPAMLWETDARSTVLLASLQCLGTLVPVGQIWVAKLIVDRLVEALRQPHPLSARGGILLLVGVELGLALLGLALTEAIGFVRTMLAERLTAHVSARILAHAQQLDLATFERPAFYDRLRRAEESALYRPAGLLFRLLDLLGGGVMLAALAVVLTRLHPLALPLLLLASIPYAVVHSREAVHLHALATAQTPETREARYLAGLLSGDAAAKELRVFGLSDLLLGRYRRILERHERQLGALARRRSARSALTGLLPAAAYASIYGYFCLQALSGHITVGDLTLYTGVVLRSQDLLQQTMFSLSGIVEHSLFLDDYFAFLALQPAPRTATRLLPSSPIRRGIRFEGVSYRYGESERPAVEDVWLDLPAGETVALVGENGAGKTTLVKLLAGLYAPCEGRVTVDGCDLRNLDPEAWRQQIAVIFQDFVRYHLTARENIGLGRAEALDDELRIAAAAAWSGADAVVQRLPRGYDTVLGSRFGGGVGLSSGEWQRVALARAFMRDAPLLVLDEPAAGLDARAEYEIFNRVRDLARDRTILLISHRFSTVRMADRIYVLDGGRLVETGTHHQLLSRAGRYAELFQLQAAGYR